MATIIVSFQSEKEAQQAIQRLSEAGVGAIRARVLDQTKPISYSKNEVTSPEIDPNLGSVEVRPTDPPLVPEADERDTSQQSATIPTTGSETQGVQVEIVTDEVSEDRIRQILGM